MLVYLIGCDHVAAQTYPEGSELGDPSNKTQREFMRLLIRAVEDHRPFLIAEEYHPEFLKRRRQRSVALEVASEVRVSHRFCDP
jgi:peptide methionine sulfoxide reductase MsrA